MPALDQSVRQAKEVLARHGRRGAGQDVACRGRRSGSDGACRVGALLRSIMLNHWYHHRGQLSVYLREVGVPVPSIYGPSADENPFAVRAAAAAR